MTGDPLLRVDGLQAGYGVSTVLHGTTFSVDHGEAVGLLGRNGMGKTTTVKALFGIIRPRAGQIFFKGARIDGRRPHAIARLGLGLVPEGRQVFPNLTVEENLATTAANFAGAAARRWTLRDIYELFPSLKERRRHMGSQLSGGEQQMVAIGRALMTNPQLLVLDEATEGLAPLIRREIWRVLTEVRRQKQSILIIDKDVRALDRIADRHVIMHKGTVPWFGTPAELRARPDIARRYLSV